MNYSPLRLWVPETVTGAVPRTRKAEPVLTMQVLPRISHLGGSRWVVAGAADVTALPACVREAMGQTVLSPDPKLAVGFLPSIHT